MKRLLIILVLVCLVTTVNAQNSYQRKGDAITLNEVDIQRGNSGNPEMIITRMLDDKKILLDGYLNEENWSSIPVATQFTQRYPNDGQEATERTEIRLLYTDTHIYIGVMAYDSAPDSISAPLFRRDGNEASDWVNIAFDSYHDKRTAFVFSVNPRGVQRDFMVYNNVNDDILWDAVWEANARILDYGWSAEIKIPLSQLRYSSMENEQIWGVNFTREVARKGEESFWAPTSREQNEIVSKFGRLTGIKDLKKPRRLEVIPYVSADLIRVPEDQTSNPYISRNDFGGNLGGDLKYGISSNMTLTATINPDFGQVEADPAVINLTANENYFQERRPFFLEGNDIFQFGRTQTFSNGGNPITFYSRRIGRSPQGNTYRAGIDAEHTEKPDNTTIAAAAKISGKTQNGWSIGFMDAYTTKEEAYYQDPSGEENSFAVEPQTNYMVGRVKKDFNEGNTYVGAFSSAVNRSIDGTYFEDFLRTSAYLGGIDFEHNFANKNWVTSGVFSYSMINGSREAISLAQTSSVRYYDRVDSEYLKLDESKTQLSGYATELSIQKKGGEGHWLTSATYAEVSPGYETNDIGFQNRSDYRTINGGLVYRENNPSWARYYEFWLFKGNAWNFDADMINNWYGTGGSINFNNLWNLNFNAQINGKQYMDRISRGGPVMERPQDWSLNFNLNSNDNKKISFNVGGFQRRDVLGEYDYSVWAGITLLPTSFIQLSISPRFSSEKDTDQYITQVSDPNATHTYGNRYVFSEIKQNAFSTSFRLNWTFSTTMSLQTYIRPFIASGAYSNFKEIARPRSYEYSTYGDDIGTITRSGQTYTVDPDGNGDSPEFTFSDPDFNYRSVQGNAVFRWEYMPGSALFLVWQQQRSDFVNAGNFDLNRDLSELFRSKPTNVFLIKLSYWFGT